jgi:hypothetical protein
MITLSKLDEDDWNNNKFTTLPLLPIFWNKSTNNLMTQDEIKTGIEENLKIKTNNFAAFQITLESKILLAGWFPLCFSDINLISIVFDYISALHEMVLRNNYNINMYNDIRTLYASSLSANYDSCFVCLCCQNKLGDHLTIICLKCGARFGNCCWTNGCIWNSRLRDIRYIESNSKSIYRVKSEHCPGCLSGLKQQQKQNINIFDNNNNNDTNQGKVRYVYIHFFFLFIFLLFFFFSLTKFISV